jgi:hypothetical protein
VDQNENKITMRAAGPQFYWEASPGATGAPRRTEAQQFVHLCYWTNSQLADQGLSTVDTSDRVALLRAYAAAVALIHQQGYAAGDISGRNVLWSTRNGPEILVIDLDDIRRIGSLAPVIDSPDWRAPAELAPWTPARDLYKLATMIVRVLAVAGSRSPRAHPPLPDDVPNRLELEELIRGCLNSLNPSPSAEDLHLALGGEPLPKSSPLQALVAGDYEAAVRGGTGPRVRRLAVSLLTAADPVTEVTFARRDEELLVTWRWPTTELVTGARVRLLPREDEYQVARTRDHHGQFSATWTSGYPIDCVEVLPVVESESSDPMNRSIHS